MERQDIKKKFIADAMLGRLARWLRFLGYDTLYYPHITDRALISIALKEDRVILTRDTGLIKIKGLKASVLITSNNVEEQIIEVLNSLKPEKIDFMSRCLVCNGIIADITDKDLIRDLVPEYVYLNNNKFYRCNSCGKIYWEGSHPGKFINKINRLLKANNVFLC